jgi:LAO/AO transport system kinase
VGQGEVDVAGAADAVVVVTAPGLGDDVQALKAGVLEIADLLVVNKADRDGADHAIKDLAAMLQITHPAAAGVAPAPPLLRAVAARGEGIDEIAAALEAVRAASCAARAARRRRQAARQVLAILSEVTRAAARAAIGNDERPGPFAPTIDAVAARTEDPWSAAEALAAARKSR